MEYHPFFLVNIPYVTSAETRLAELLYRSSCNLQIQRAPKETSSHIHNTVNVICRLSFSKQDVPNTQFKVLRKFRFWVNIKTDKLGFDNFHVHLRRNWLLGL